MTNETILLLLAGGSVNVDPSGIDSSNNVIVLDGDLEMTTTISAGWRNQVNDQAYMTWESRSGTSHDAPPPILVQDSNINGHKFCQFFAGDNKTWGKLLTPVIDISEGCSWYFLVKLNVENSSYWVIGDAVNGSRHQMKIGSGSDTNYVINGASIPTPRMTLGKWHILSSVLIAGSGNSRTRIYTQDGADVTTTGTFTVTLDLSGIGIAGDSTERWNGGVSFGYVLGRKTSDSIDTQEEIFSAIKAKYGI